MFCVRRLFEQLISLLSNPRKIVDCATRTLLISYNAVCSSKSSGGSNLPLTLSIYLEEDLAVLVNACGNGRYTTPFDNNHSR